MLTILLGYSYSFFSQSPFLVEEEFNTGPPLAGWGFAGGIGNYTSGTNSGKSVNSLKFQNTADQATSISWAGGGDQITFMMRGTGTPNATDNMLVEVFNGSWSTLANVRPHSTAKVYTLPISTAVTQARFTYTKGGTNVAFDDFTVRKTATCTATGMYITSINVDACGSGCEGRDEFFTFKNGNVALAISDVEFSYPDANTSSVTWCGTSANNPCDNFIVTSGANVTALNTLAGCSIFLNPGASIPANAKVMVFNGNPQNTLTNFSNLCASGVQYYALFANNTTDCNGRFGNFNSSCSDCYRGFFLRNRNNGCTDTNRYDQSLIANYDGAAVAYSSSGVSTYISPGSGVACNFVFLPLRITNFYAVTSNQTALYWEAQEDKDIKNYKVETSLNGIDFFELGEVNSKRSEYKNYYQFLLQNSDVEIGNYYRLKATQDAGDTIYSSIIFTAKPNGNAFFVKQLNEKIFVQINSNTNGNLNFIDVYNVLGQKVASYPFTGSSFSFDSEPLKSQLCLITISSGNQLYKQRIYIK